MLTEQELEERRHFIGGSEIGAVLGESAFSGPYDVFASKTYGVRKTENDDMKRGSFLEPGVADWYADRYAVPLEKVAPVRHPTLPFARCSPDRLAVLEDGTKRLVSIKCPRHLWAELPWEYELQLQWEHAIVSAWAQLDAWCSVTLDPVMHLAACADGELRVYEVTADVELQAGLLDYAGRWWRRHIIDGVEPPLDGSPGAAAHLRRKFPRDANPVRPATLHEEALLLDLRAAEEALDSWAKAYDNARQHVEAAIGDAAGIDGATGRVTWRADKNSKRSLRTKWTNNKEQHQ